MIWTITVTIVGIMIFDIVQLLKKKKIGESAAVIIIMLLALFNAYNVIFDWNFPNWLDIVGFIYSPFSKWVFNF